MSIIYKSLCKYDTAGQGYDESVYDIGTLQASEAIGGADTIKKKKSINWVQETLGSIIWTEETKI